MEPISTESFLLLCKQSGLDRDDLEDMTIGMCLDYIQMYVEMNKPNKKKPVRRAMQRDFDGF